MFYTLAETKTKTDMATTIEEARVDRYELELQIGRLLEEYSRKHEIELNTIEIDSAPVPLSAFLVGNKPVFNYNVRITFKY